MKNIIFLLVMAIFSCRTEVKPDEQPADVARPTNAWSTYEGRVPLNETTDLYLELSMHDQNANKEGSFILKEYLEGDHVSTPAGSYAGKYSTLYGNVPGKILLQFHNSAHPEGFKRTYPYVSRGSITGTSVKVIREEFFRNTDLVVMITGTNKLVVLDQHLQPVSLERELNLYKRTSRLFTIEGYFRHLGDTAEFVEMNTRERWPVSKLGDYYHAIRQYHQLTTNKFQVTYLKAVAFSIERAKIQQNGSDALVIKKVLQMSSSPGLNDEYERLVP